MASRQTSTTDDWQLGTEPAEQPLNPPDIIASKADLSATRLDRELAVIRVEHAAWAAVVVWTLLTRLAMLGARPLDAAEASRALFEYDLAFATRYASAVGYHPIWAGWVHALEAAIFAICGSGDLRARLLFAIVGLLIVSGAFLMRFDIGRAGGLFLALLIAVSPSFAYFSRLNCDAIVTAATAMAVLVLFTRVARSPSMAHAIGLGCAGGLLASSGSAGPTTLAALLVALALTGVANAFVVDHPRLRIRIWFTRRTGLLAATLLAAVATWSVSELILFRPIEIWQGFVRLWTNGSLSGYSDALRFYTPGIAFYDFLIALLTIAAIATVVTFRIRSWFGLFSLFWLLSSCACLLWSNDRRPERLIEVLVPASILAAILVDRLHRSSLWVYVRPIIVLLAILTIYVQILANFIYATPNVNEANWKRHANLYWYNDVTTLQAGERLEEIRRDFPSRGGSVFNRGEWQPAMRWYLRDFRTTSDANLADLVVDSAPAGSSNSDQFESTYVIELSESWHPAPARLTPGVAIRFFFTAIAWSPLEPISVSVTVRPPSGIAPTVILPPGAAAPSP